MPSERQEDDRIPRKPGRPPVYREPRGEVRIRLPVALIQAIEASGETMTAYIEHAVREKLAREQEDEAQRAQQSPS